MPTDDPRIIEAKRKPVDHVLSMLKVSGQRDSKCKKEFVGPCPICHDTGHNPKSGPPDRFNINRKTGAYFCRRCGIRGGDVIALVQEVRQFSFPDALTFLAGERPQDETPEQKRARKKREQELKAKAEREEQQRQADAARYRKNVIADARRIWTRARPGHLGVVPAYLKARGLTPDMFGEIPHVLRFIVDHPYVKKIGGELVTAHRGPCMIAAIQDAKGDLTAVHQTWIDTAPPHGKARVEWNGEALPAKMVRGSKKGGAIRLHTPLNATTLIMGEGIETTLSALVARPVENAAYWAGVDLGNMSGKMAREKGKRHSGQPDLSDSAAFVPPAWVRRLIYIMDGDSDPKMTRAKLECGLGRAMALRPGLKGQIVNPGRGVDLNDLLQPSPQEKEG